MIVVVKSVVIVYSFTYLIIIFESLINIKVSIGVYIVYYRDGFIIFYLFKTPIYFYNILYRLTLIIPDVLDTNRRDQGKKRIFHFSILNIVRNQLNVNIGLIYFNILLISTYTYNVYTGLPKRNFYFSVRNKK